MLSRRNKLSLLVLGCALALSAGGCRAPWSGSNNKAGDASLTPTLTREVTVDPPPTPAAGAMAENQLTDEVPPGAPATLSPTAGSQPAKRDDTDMAGVLEKLQEVAELDPAAQAKLIEKLQGTKPEYWPLVAEQFRASLAFHQQLLAKEEVEQRVGGAASAKAPTASTTPMASANRTRVGGVTEPIVQRPNAVPSDTGSASPPLSAVGQTSTPIGALVDPRGVRPDTTPDELLVVSNPTRIVLASHEEDINQLAADPAVPREFIAQGTTYPITPATPVNTATPAVLPVSLDASAVAAANGTTDGAPPAQRMESPPEWQKLVFKAAEDLSRHVAESPATTAEIHQHVSLRILRLLAGDTEKALEPIPHISPVEQDYWSRQLFAMATYMDHYTQPDDKRRAAASVVHLDEAVASLHELGSLSLRNLTFCKKVYDYGAYDPYEHDHFTPGQQLSLYVEVDNFHSHSTEKGFCTSLGSTYELLSDQGTRIDGGEFPDVEDCCRSRRRDFHVQYGLVLPKALPPGKYQLQLVVRDRGSDKIGHASVAFEVAGGTK